MAMRGAKGVYASVLLLLAAGPAVAAMEVEENYQNDQAYQRSESPAKNVTLTGSEVFGEVGGYFHPFLSITESYTDNIDNTPKDTHSDMATVISPGLWVAVPRVNQIMLEVASSNTSPGGHFLNLNEPEYFNRYQLYALYNANIERYQDYSANDTTKQRAEFFGQYNLRGGLAFNLIDQFQKTADPSGVGDFTKLDKYDSNLAHLIVSYNFSERFRFRTDYSVFLIDHEDPTNPLDREDDAVAAYLFYKYSPKTSLFTEYEIVGVKYDDAYFSDSIQHHGYIGTRWQYSDKTRVKVMLGVAVKDFARSELDTANELVGELTGDYAFSPKVSCRLILSRKLNEAGVANSAYAMDNGVSAQYNHAFTEKIAGNLRMSYTSSDYQAVGGSSNREDNNISVSPGVQYYFKEWLGLGLSYSYTSRDSNIDGSDYSNNSLSATIFASM